MIISVASGKGGTGKTTVATNMALSLKGPLQFLDCDVEEPNAHLFVHPAFEKTDVITTPVPEVNPDKCNLCGQCDAICQFKAIVLIGESVLTFPELCHSCGGCVEVCPENAVKETQRELGLIQQGRRNGIAFAQGKLRVGEAMSPPLIKQVRSRYRSDRPTIIDAPPGTSCPVIASMNDVDFVLLVTEPTPFGLHDLKLAVGAVKVLGIPCGLVINRSDIGNREVIDYAEREHLPVLMEIPFDRRIAEVYSEGKALVDVMPEWKQRFIDLYQKIEEIVQRRSS